MLVPGRASGTPMWNELLATLPTNRPIYALDAIGDAGLSTPTVPQAWKDRGLAALGGTSVGDVQERTAISEMIDAGSSGYSAALPTPRVLTDDQLHSLTMPVYVAIASNSSLAGGTKAASRAKKLLPRARVRTWENTTHSLPFQAAEPLGLELAEFWGLDYEVAG